jgi:hypothetical protein
VSLPGWSGPAYPVAGAELGGAVGQGRATVGQFVGPAGEVVAGVVDVIGHLLAVAPPGHRAADGIAKTLRPPVMAR